MESKEVIAKLDEISSEMEKESKVIAYAIDRIADMMERTAGLLDTFKSVLKGMKDVGTSIIDNIKPLPKEQAVTNLVSIMKKYPDAEKRISDFLDTLLKAGLDPMSREAASLPADLVSDGISAVLSLVDKKVTKDDVQHMTENERLTKSIMSLCDSISLTTKEIIKKFSA